MAQLRQDYEEFVRLDTEIVVVGPDNAKQFSQYWEENQLQFIGLPDPQHTVLKLFGQEVNLFKLGRMPAQVIIDKQGVARYAHYGHAMSDIPANEEIIAILEEIQQED
jgi:peroxiredoxin Q/BCP